MSWYISFKPSKAIETDEGIKAKSRRGEFVTHWWATRWIRAMERVMDSGRLGRGRTYARKGQVLSLDVGKGTVAARVQGSRRTPYKIAIELQPLSEADWAKVTQALAERPYFVAQLLAGEMPAEIEQAFAAAKLDLFPGRRDLKQSCSCPDSAAVCKHIAAVHYILAERLDEDPFLLFQLRGRTRDAIVAGIGSVAAGEDATAGAVYAPAPPLGEAVAAMWQSGSELEAFAVRIVTPETPYPVLERLGDPDFLPEARRWLAAAYDKVSEKALQVAYPENPRDGE